MLKAGCLILIVLMLSGCAEQNKPQGPKYHKEPRALKTRTLHLAVHPLHNPAKLAASYQPLVNYLNKQIPDSNFELEASRDYASFETKVTSGSPELLIPNPLQTLRAISSGYSVLATLGSPEDFRGIILVRKDSNISVPADLKGKSVSYPSSTALAACIMPKLFLHKHGLDVTKDIDNRYVGSQESVIWNVYQKFSTAGGTWPIPWRIFQKEHPAEASQMKAIWETTHLINNSFMIRSDIPDGLKSRIQKLLVHLEQSEEGRKILEDMGADRFRPATNSDYDQVRRYLSDYEREVGPVEGM